MEKARLEEFRSLASEVRKDIVRMVGVAHSGPLEAPLALSDLFVYLYWEELIVLPGKPRRADRDRLALGLENAVPALYAVLARRGFFDREELWHYRRLGAMLQALPDFRRTPGIDAPCVTTGSELSAASSMASVLGGSVSAPRVFCLVADDAFETEEFHAAARASSEPGLVLLVWTRADLNCEVLKKRADALREYGWNVFFANGNDFQDMEGCFARLENGNGRPSAIFLTTNGAQEISFVSGTGGAQSMNLEEMDHALEELEEKSDAE